MVTQNLGSEVNLDRENIFLDEVFISSKYYFKLILLSVLKFTPLEIITQ